MRRALVAFGIGLGLLGSTVISAPAQAASPVTAPLASTVATAQEVAAFWLADGAANLKSATPYAVQTVAHGERTSTPIVPDGNPGVVPPLPGPTPPKGKLPTTSGKVFFIGADGQPHWCTGTAMQSSYKNVVATAGHCVKDTQSAGAMLDKWVFVPGYSEGTTPWGLYVAKQAFVHYDFDVYEDYDRDFAFVTVYNGVVLSSSGVLTDSGRLGDNVGGQGLAYNQATTSSVDVFGYPAGPNPDGTQPYTGQTLERSYGKTFNAMAPDINGERLIGVDSPFTGEGSLGSAWLYNYSNGNRSGYLNGITISVSDTDGDNRYDTSVSPYFDGELYGVYNMAKNLWSGTIL
ncbi:trypsin-like serine peptidase [Microtetraspora malaysiensis]|uniref:trypsin-like serine peptidase n=1 Tax=Microtetraspora malaysiensis TaxID=161358 RepID=UPI003D8CD5E6